MKELIKDVLLLHTTDIVNDLSGQYYSFKKNNKSLLFIDGGQADLLVASNYCLSFIRAVSVGKKRVKKEYYVLVRLQGSKVCVCSYPKWLELELDVSELDFKEGRNISLVRVVSACRRLLELSLVSDADYVVLDGSLEQSTLDKKYFPKEKNICGLSKTNNILVNNKVLNVILNKKGSWYYYPVI